MTIPEMGAQVATMSGGKLSIPQALQGCGFWVAKDGGVWEFSWDSRRAHWVACFQGEVLAEINAKDSLATLLLAALVGARG
jgi:hypothetical protein